MRIDIDSYREVLDTLTRNKSRSFLTGFGVFWGVFMLVALMGGGQGLEGTAQQQFRGLRHQLGDGLGATDHQTLPRFPQRTTWELEYKDVERCAKTCPNSMSSRPCSSTGAALLISATKSR